MIQRHLSDRDVSRGGKRNVYIHMIIAEDERNAEFFGAEGNQYGVFNIKRGGDRIDTLTSMSY